VSPDAINGTLELIGSALVWFNVLALWRAKQVRGVHWGSSAFFCLWGAWNLYFYPALGQWFSFYGGISVIAANVTWVMLAVRYGDGRVEPHKD
jgi:hypothetical protein